MKRIFLLVLSVALLLALDPASGLAQPAAGNISIMVVNGTPGGDQPSGADVLLQTAGENGLQEAARGKLDPAGTISFAGLDSAKPYVATITYKGVPFFSDLIQFTAGQTTVTVTVSVFESTGDAAVISDARVAMFVTERDGIIEVTEAHSVTNSSQLAYVGSAPAVGGRFQTVRIGLPSGASVPTYVSGFSETSVQRDGNVLTDTRPVLPGQKDYAFSYQLVYLSDELAMTRRFFIPTSRFDIFVPGGVLDLTGDRLARGDTVEINGSKLENYSVSSIAAGNAVTMTMGNLPYHGTLTSLRNVILIVGSVAGLGLIAWRIMRRNKTGAQNKAPEAN